MSKKVPKISSASNPEAQGYQSVFLAFLKMAKKQHDLSRRFISPKDFIYGSEYYRMIFVIFFLKEIGEHINQNLHIYFNLVRVHFANIFISSVRSSLSEVNSPRFAA
ncbi:hypothetical protein [Leptospira weilii]|uniref:hypothetical protein n=1 Tax=Leptospira weilii TaxID=28184 RepID=UPI0002BDA4B5|nr:hypothetical protein [Leptospira weilii]EMN43363.1 hypothetical protein LEP1GSC086_1035 [Leptospira weilii str. LNT 1234]QDK23865.1 hypothetical protein FHG67_14940 [Leptospira weilii]QDK26498.1 hypothetical protein FHG68_07320 [Leptospira weilii]ULH28790.1 hypothetical protein FH586_02220 [Leptospira weilii]UPY80755.1 hypothetical protein FH581_021980 [Leptospira weilii]